MLEINKRLTLKTAIDAATGDIQVFLERLVVEVVSANYRHFLSEKTELDRNGYENSNHICWPPLFANERQVSGIFSSSLNAMCPSTSAEHKVHRRLEIDEEEGTLIGVPGRVDFMSSYGNRYIGLELKRGTIGTTESGEYIGLKSKWDDVEKQSKDVHTFMRQKEYTKDYPNGTGVGLMVIRVAKQVSKNKDVPEEIERLSDKTKNISSEINSLLKPDFLATYTPPAEMQAVSGFGKQFDAFKIFPKILFTAVVHGKAGSLKV